MTILYVDAEHERIRQDPALGLTHRVKLDEAAARLADAAGEPCQVLHFSDVSPTSIGRVAPTAMVISGSTADWAEYDFGEMAGLLDTIRAAPVPILGLCAGHQLIGVAHRARWGPLGALRDGEVDPDPRFGPGQRKERGFLPVQVDPDCPLFRGLATTPTFYQSHYWQLANVPDGFVLRASSSWSSIQAIERRDRPVFGVQFHPERYDDTYADGAVVLRNFFALAQRSHRD